MSAILFVWGLIGAAVFFRAQPKGSPMDVDIECWTDVRRLIIAGPAVWSILTLGLLTGTLKGSISND